MINFENGTFICDECNNENSIENSTERGAFALICPECAKRLEFIEEGADA